MNYSEYVTQISTIAVVEETDENFVIILPQASINANLRICRDLDLMQFSGTYIASIPSGSRQITYPDGTFVTTEQVNLILPAGVSNPDAGERKALLSVSKEYIDAVYGSSSQRSEPENYAMFDDNKILVGPFSNAVYSVEIIGMTRPLPLSEANTETFLATYFPDLYIAATMSYVTAYQRNWGAMADDPKMAQSWENSYSTLLQGASMEEARKKYSAAAWSSEAPAQFATPTRG